MTAGIGLGRKLAAVLVGAVALWLAPNAVAADQLLETVNVDPAKPAVTSGTVQLKQGTEYQLQISGTFTLANGYGQSFDEDALYCFGDMGFATPQCTTPQRFGDFYIGSGSSSLKNIDAYQERAGGGPPIGYGITHRYNVNFYPPANGPLIAGGPLAQSQCKSGPNPCTTTISGGPITIQIYGPAPPPPPPPPPTKPSPIAIAKPAIAWNVPTSLLMLAAGKTGFETSPPLAKGQTSASAEVTGSGVNKVKPVLTAGYKVLFCVAFALDTTAKQKPETETYYSPAEQKIVSVVVKTYEKVNPNDVAPQVVLNMIVCLANFDSIVRELTGGKVVVPAGGPACPVSSQRFNVGELDTKKIRLKPTGAGQPANLSVACARSSSGMIVALKSHGTDLRSIFGPHLLLGLYNDHTAIGTAGIQVTFSNGAAPPPPPPPSPTFTGTWNTSFGPMTLTQSGNQVTGTYADCPNNGATISGTVSGSALDGTWTEPCHNAQGRIHFVLSADGKSFTGLWGQGSAAPTNAWNGTRTS